MVSEAISRRRCAPRHPIFDAPTTPERVCTRGMWISEAAAPIQPWDEALATSWSVRRVSVIAQGPCVDSGGVDLPSSWRWPGLRLPAVPSDEMALFITTGYDA
jgi:hypothetical protein